MLHLMDLTALDDRESPAQIVTLRFGSGGYVTRPTDTPPNAFYLPRLRVPINYTRNMFAVDGATSGRASIGVGIAELIANDGALDYLRDLAIDGRELVTWALPDARSPWSARVKTFSGTVEQGLFNWRRITLRLRDRLAELAAKNVLTTFYAGTTTSSGATAEGTADYKDRPKPRVWGKVLNVTPANVNAYDLIYQVNDGPVASIDAVYSNGAAITASGSDYPNLAALQAASVPAGQFATCIAIGMFRLGGAPGGLITCDATQGASAAARTAAQIAKALLTGPGELTGADYDDATFTALDGLNSAVCGTYVDEQRSVLDVASDVLDSIGGWLVPTRLGLFQVGRFDTPGLAPAATFTAAEILDRGDAVERLPTGDQGRGVPAWRVIVRYARNYTVMRAGQLAGSVSPESASFFNSEFRERASDGPDVRLRHPLAPEMSFNTLLANESDAAAETTRRQSLYGVQRDRYKIKVKSEYAASLNLSWTVRLVLNRYGLSAGKNFVIIGFVEDAERNITELDLWG